jgi:hypothetical protein
MNHSIILLLSLALIAGMLSPAYAQTISNNVVINEVDTNPYGDDSAGPFEWVEIYNPTDSDVDLSGWQIASTTVLKKTFIIPDGTIISPGAFLTYTNAKIWFTDLGELVELRNHNGTVIDKTPTITDLQNNFLSWQRIYDGYSDWEFALATAGGSNGKFIPKYVPSPVIVIVSSDQLSYQFDDVAIIQGTVSEKIYAEKPFFQVEPILINISGPNYSQSVSLYPDSDLTYEMTLSLVQVLGINEGIYHVSVTYAGVTTDTSFSVSPELIQEQDQTDTVFDIQTEKSEYYPGQSILITGFTTEIIPFESMKFTLIDANDNLVGTGNLFTTNGEFNTEIFLPTTNPSYGTYQIVAEYFDQRASITFDVIEFLNDVAVSESSKSTIILNIAQSDFHEDCVNCTKIIESPNSEFLLNEYLHLSGSIGNYGGIDDLTMPSAFYNIVELSFFTNDGKPVTFIGHTNEEKGNNVGEIIPFTGSDVPDTSGTFSVTIQLPPVIFSQGDYVVKAKFGSLVTSKVFSIVSEKSIPVSHVRTIIEKTNRISDDLISINTQEKIIEEQSVKPRVLSGSMMTMSKDAQSNVNLQVVSDSGICIIGQSDECLVSDSTRKPGQIFDVVEVDGLNLNVRYTGPDVRLEKFSILPESSTEFLPDANWNVEVIKDDEISRFYYKITYKTLE